MEHLEGRSLLAAVTEVEPNNSLLNAQSLSGASSFEIAGNVSTLTDVDYYSFPANAGSRISLNVRALNPAAPSQAQFDPVIGLFDPSGNLVAFDDDSGSGSFWAGGLSYAATQSGTWVVAISDYYDFNFDGIGGDGDGFGTDTGAYVLTITGAVDVDLIAASFLISSHANAAPLAFNRSFVLEARVSNSGQGAASGFDVSFYASQDAVIDTSDVPIGTEHVSGLGGNADITVGVQGTLPQNLDWFGRIHFGVIINLNRAVLESNFTNNANQGRGIDREEIQLYDPIPTVQVLPQTFASQRAAAFHLFRLGYLPQFPGTGRGWTLLLPSSSSFTSRFDGVTRSGLAYRFDAGIISAGGVFQIEVQGTLDVAEPSPEAALAYGTDWFNYVDDWHDRF